MSSFRPEDLLARVPDMISTELDQETVLMHIEAGAYYGLEGPAQIIWQALESPLSFAALVDRLTAEYDVSPETCAADVEKFLLQMRIEGLLLVNPTLTA
jgi:Coenzyme PQQ synthesis protein D (PqqD)